MSWGWESHSWKKPSFSKQHLRGVAHCPEQDVNISVKALKPEGLFVTSAMFPEVMQQLKGSVRHHQITKDKGVGPEHQGH